MRASSALLNATVDDRDQQVTYTFDLALPADLEAAVADVFGDVALTVQAVNVQGDTVTDQVAGTRLDDGYTAFEATVRLAGHAAGDETKTVAWLFARYPFPAGDGTLSPLAYRDLHDVEVTIGFGPTTAATSEVFAGFVDSYTQNDDGEVELTLIDRRTLLRGEAELPAVITAPPQNAGLTSEFALDYLLRASTKGAVSSWPALRPQAVLAVGFRASVWPETGLLDAGSTQPTPRFAPGPCGTGLAGWVPVKGGFSGPTYTTSAPLGDTVVVELLASDLTADGVVVQVTAATAGAGVVSVRVVDGAITVTVRGGTGAGSGSIPVSDSWTWVLGVLDVDDTTPIGVAVSWPRGSATWRATLRWGPSDDAAGDSGDRTYAVRSNVAWTRVQVLGGGDAAAGMATGVLGGVVAGLQVTGEPLTGPAAAQLRTGFEPRAVLDESLNPLLAIPPISGDAWQTIQDIAAAELGIAGFFGGRVFRFLNRRTLTGRDVVKTVTSDGALETLGVTSDRASIVNRARVGYTAWSFATARTTVWQATDPVRVPRKGTAKLTVNLEGFAVAIDATVAVLADGVADVTQSWMRVARDRDGVAKHPGGVTARLVSIAANRVDVVLTNTSSLDAWLVSSADYTDVAPGTPLFTLAGRAVTPADEVTVDYQWPTPELGGAASSRFGEVAADVTGNAWVQFAGTALDLAKAIVLDNYEPRCEFTNVAIRPDPRLEPGDALHVVDAHRTGVDEYVRLFGFELDYDTGSSGGGALTYEMSINARAFGPPGAWLLGIEGRSELGVTTFLR